MLQNWYEKFKTTNGKAIYFAVNSYRIILEIIGKCTRNVKDIYHHQRDPKEIENWNRMTKYKILLTVWTPQRKVAKFYKENEIAG